MRISKVSTPETKSLEQVAKSIPSLGEALYTPPNPDGTRKKCSSCFMFVKGKDRCLIHGNQDVDEDDVCGYHVFGKPQTEQIAGIQELDKSMTGFLCKGDGDKTPDEGTSCESCKHYTGNATKGTCGLLRGKPDVEAKGCCARWRTK